MISPGVFFQFFKILIFHVVRGVKGQKAVQNDKKFCPSRLISQKPYIIWLSFMVHVSKMIISPGSFFIFSKFWFFRLLRGLNRKKWSNFFHFFKILIFRVVRGVGKRAKNGRKWQKKMTKNSVRCTPYLRNNTSCDCHLWYTFVNLCSGAFFII